MVSTSHYEILLNYYMVTHDSYHVKLLIITCFSAKMNATQTILCCLLHVYKTTLLFIKSHQSKQVSFYCCWSL